MPPLSSAFCTTYRTQGTVWQHGRVGAHYWTLEDSMLNIGIAITGLPQYVWGLSSQDSCLTIIQPRKCLGGLAKWNYSQFSLQHWHWDEKLKVPEQILQTPNTHYAFHQTSWKPARESISITSIHIYLQSECAMKSEGGHNTRFHKNLVISYSHNFPLHSLHKTSQPYRWQLSPNMFKHSKMTVTIAITNSLAFLT